MTETDNIDEPNVEISSNKKRIYFVRNLFLPENATDVYKSIFDRYWNEVKLHFEETEAAGKIKKVFCESIYMTGEDAMKVLSSMNVHLEALVKNKIENGAELIPLEDKDIFGAYVDWNNCLMIVRTENVYGLVHHHLKESVKDRFEFIKAILRENINDGESGLLIMRDGDQKLLDLPDDIELSIVTPPAYDDLIQFIRDAHSGKEFWRKD